MRRVCAALVVFLGAVLPIARERSALAQETTTPEIITAEIDKTALDNGGTIVVTGKAPADKPVYIEVWSEKKVRVSRFDADVDPDSGKRPYILYMSQEMPAYYVMHVPAVLKENLDPVKKDGAKWSFSKALANVAADGVYSAPARIAIERYQATLLGSIVGSRGNLMPAMDAGEVKRRSMQLVKARFRVPDRVLATDVVIQPDGTYRAEIKIRSDLAPGAYTVLASVNKKLRSKPVTFENRISLPLVYLNNAGTSVNIFGPFFLTLAIAIFGVLMGAGGGFIMNPLLVSIWPLPHTVVAGTVMPTVLFSQGSGIVNYSKIKFISWKLGIAIGLAMVAGGFIGPKLTELITLAQFKFVFGWILIVLAALMLWQTTPGYLARNKKEQAVLKECKLRAEAEAKARRERKGAVR